MNPPTSSAAQGAPQHPGRLVARCTWWAHLALVVLVGAYVVLSTIIAPEVDANIGFGLGMMGLSALGMPWTLPGIVGLYSGRSGLDSPVWILVATSGALLNLFLHALVLRKRSRVRDRA